MKRSNNTISNSIVKWSKTGAVLFLLVLTNIVFAQKNQPKFKAFIDSSEINHNQGVAISAGIKTTDGYFPIINKQNMTIELPSGVDVKEIQYFRFTVDQDIIIFPVRKLVDNYENLSPNELEKRLKNIFRNIDKWELYIDNVQYYVGDVSQMAVRPSEKNSNFQNFKVYALKTDVLKYYVVKG